MGKIPVGRTIGQTYEFVFQKYGSLLGVVWLPMVALAALGYFLFLPALMQIFDQLPWTFQHPGEPDFTWMISGAFLWLRLFQVLVLLLFVVIRVGITKEALGIRKGPKFFYVPADSSELLVVVCYIILYVAMIAVIIAAVIAGAFIALLAGSVAAAAGHFDLHAPGQQLWGILGLVLLVAVLGCAAFYILVRLTFLMIPATVAERRIGIGRSWSLTRGNFWRIVVVVIAAWLPLIVLEGIVFSIVGLPFMLQVAAAAHGNHADVHALFQSLAKNMIYYIPWFWGVGLLFAPIFFGLTTAPSAFAYRALVPPPA
ncbi:MAG TPA: hypothetical protein VG867_10515 [Rhizomicrobium sp.]|nr:hypothetical protein [Rhizomicrobium sp.]